MVIRRFKSFITPVLLVMIFILFGLTHLLGDASEVKPVKYVEVTQRSGKVERLDYDTFSMSWILPITLKTQIDREDIILKKEDFEEIYIVGDFSSGWDEDKEDWGIMVYLLDKRELLGFFHVSEHVVKGISSITGEEKSIPFKDVKKISFKR